MHIKLQIDEFLEIQHFHVIAFHKIEHDEIACTSHEIAHFIVWVNWMCVNASTAHVDGSTSCSKCRVRTRLDSQSAGAYVHQIVLKWLSKRGVGLVRAVPRCLVSFWVPFLVQRFTLTSPTNKHICVLIRRPYVPNWIPKWRRLRAGRRKHRGRRPVPLSYGPIPLLHLPLLR